LQGLAYVEFEDEQSLEAAVAKNKEEFLGRPLNVARSDPKSGRSGGRGSGSAGGRGAAGGRGIYCCPIYLKGMLGL
jgi:RNA recognition motif-containing protein